LTTTFFWLVVLRPKNGMHCMLFVLKDEFQRSSYRPRPPWPVAFAPS
jgi:hypothetical protein